MGGGVWSWRPIPQRAPSGPHPGIPATQAQALVPGLLTRDADPEKDAAALERLALWALQRYAPVVAAGPPDELMLEVSGVGHLHGGEDAMLGDLVGRLARAGIDARAAMAATHGAARALARYCARPTLVIDNDVTPDALAALPIAALRLPAELVASLRRLGFERIGGWRPNHARPWRCALGRSSAAGSIKPTAAWPSR